MEERRHEELKRLNTRLARKTGGVNRTSGAFSAHRPLKPERFGLFRRQRFSSNSKCCRLRMVSIRSRWRNTWLLQDYELKMCSTEREKLFPRPRKGEQLPAEYSKLTETFYFHPTGGEETVKVQPIKPAPLLKADPEIPAGREWPSTGPEAAVALYYEKVNSRALEGAYASLSSEFQRRRSLEDYKEVFVSTVSIYRHRS